MNDFDGLYELYADPTTSPYLDYEPAGRVAFGAVFDGLVRAGETYLVFDGELLVATYRLHRQTHRCSHVATLGGFVVARSARGGGVSRGVMADIVERVQRDGVRRLELMVEADNPRAIRFYEACGFEGEGLLRGAFRRRRESEDVDEVVMAKRF